VLSVSAENNLGATTGSVTFFGGTLLDTVSFATSASKPIRLSSGGGTLEAAVGNTFTISGNVVGSNPLTKGANSSTVLLLGTNSPLNTTILGGTLQIGNGGAGATIGVGSIINSGALVFNHSDNLLATQAISGGGSITRPAPAR
jgi:hypothetical protein